MEWLLSISTSLLSRPRQSMCNGLSSMKPVIKGFAMMAMGRLGLENFPRSVSSSIFCMDLLSAFNNARFKFQGSGSNTLEVMSICLNHIKLKKFQENF